MTQPTHPTAHGVCPLGHTADHHRTVAEAAAGRDHALQRLTAVWAALNRAGVTGPASSAAELIDQLAAQRDELAAQVHATYPPADMQRFLDHTAKEFAVAHTSGERVEVIRDCLEGWYDRWDATYVTDEHEGIARHLVALIYAAEARASTPAAPPAQSDADGRTGSGEGYQIPRDGEGGRDALSGLAGAGSGPDRAQDQPEPVCDHGVSLDDECRPCLVDTYGPERYAAERAEG
ncbi:hypothetical protein QTQ03_16605 [Micromonospora sp. WMMA1363]|uniref:hypothetical protein n=1 Tax=Micromonospora sp. WMMA1363 TaxID=3053985 RepID=UPI00259CAF43|nr:hypothetical protein [Micromonospora sp. WMMA1363]MDM4721140.1 hypothetical protein [Micromonospora sp. WMMA1363]